MGSIGGFNKREPLSGEAQMKKTQHNKERYATLFCHPNGTQNVRMAQQTYNRLCSNHFFAIFCYEDFVSQRL